MLRERRRVEILRKPELVNYLGNDMVDALVRCVIDEVGAVEGAIEVSLVKRVIDDLNGDCSTHEVRSSPRGSPPAANLVPPPRKMKAFSETLGAEESDVADGGVLDLLTNHGIPPGGIFKIVGEDENVIGAFGNCAFQCEVEIPECAEFFVFVVKSYDFRAQRG